MNDDEKKELFKLRRVKENFLGLFFVISLLALFFFPFPQNIISNISLWLIIWGLYSAS